MKNIFKITALAVLLTTAIPAQATNGYFLPGFGVKSQGMGGVGIALQQDSLSQAANPANATQTGRRWDLGLSLFNPERQAATGPATGLMPPAPVFFNESSDSGNTLFLMPDAAFTLPLNNSWSVGIALVGNGGMNTTFGENIFGTTAFPAAHGAPNDPVGVDLMQLLVPLTVAYKLNEQHSVGASLNLAAQRFAAYGLGQFAFFGISSDSSKLTNQGHDYSYGAGLRLGWLGKFMDDRVSVGATWASRTYMSKFDKYKGLFAEQGDFDLPENFGLGLAIKPTKALTIAADIVKIKYSDVASVANPGPGILGGSGYDNLQVFAAATGFPLGSPQPYSLGNDKGMGFGWQDMTVYKLGFMYDVDDSLTVRAGYNYGKTPVRNDQLVFSALAPGIVEEHYSIGFTKQFKGWELSGTYMYVAENKQQGCGQAVVECVSYKMDQEVLGVSFGFKY